MRKCIRCGAEMEENFTITSGTGIVVRREGLSMKSVKPKVAVCPKCGEVSIYIEDFSKLKK